MRQVVLSEPLQLVAQSVAEPPTARHVTLEELPAAFPTWLAPQAGVLKATVDL
jgi:hypothetical protein